jgi:hypothetical protein
MRALLFSIVVYLAGIAAVLFLRPTLMFDREGRWKEFGLRRDDATVFPFWLFCIAWAVVSYSIGRLITPTEPVNWIQSASTAMSLTAAGNGIRSSLAAPTPVPVALPAAPAPPSASNLLTPLPVSGPASKGGRRRRVEASALKQLKQLGGGSKQLPKGLYFFVGDEDDEDDSASDASED